MCDAFRDTEDLDGLFSGFDADTGSYDPAGAAAETALAAAEPDRLTFPFAMTDAGELLDALPRHETTHGALLADIVDQLRVEPARSSIASARCNWRNSARASSASCGTYRQI